MFSFLLTRAQLYKICMHMKFIWKIFDISGANEFAVCRGLNVRMVKVDETHLRKVRCISCVTSLTLQGYFEPT